MQPSAISPKSSLGKHPAPQDHDQYLPPANRVKPTGDSAKKHVNTEESDIRICVECNKEGSFKELSEHDCSEFSDSGTASLQSKKIEITNPDQKYQEHQLNSLVWMLKTYHHEWNNLAKAFDVSEDNIQHIETVSHDDTFRMLVVLHKMFNRCNPDWNTKLNKGTLMEALQKIKVDSSTLEKINNIKFEEQPGFPELVASQINCSDDLGIKITDPDKRIESHQLSDLVEMLSEYACQWQKLAVVLGFRFSEIEEIRIGRCLMASGSNMLLMRNLLDTAVNRATLKKHTLMTALQLIGINRSDLKKADGLL